MNAVKIVIPFTLPGLNDYIAAERVHRQKAAKMKRYWQEAVILAVRRQIRGRVTGALLYALSLDRARQAARQGQYIVVW